jgi:hypothetical protein
MQTVGIEFAVIVQVGSSEEKPRLLNQNAKHHCVDTLET